MLIKDIMDHHPVTIQPNTTVAEARQLLQERHLSAIPVVENKNRLKGLVTHNCLMINPDLVGSHDIMELSEFLADLKVKKAMIKGPDLICISQDKTIEEASSLMLREKVGCLPVVEEKRLIGLITRDDLLIQLTEMMVADMPAVRATLRVPMVRGEMAKLVNAISKAGLGILASGLTVEHPDDAYCRVVIKTRNTTINELTAILQAVPDQELLDIREM